MPQFLKKPSSNGAAATEGDTTDVAEPQARELLGALLLEAGLLDESQLDEAVSEGNETGARLGEVVVRRGWATEDDVARVLADQAGLGYLDRSQGWVDAKAPKRGSRPDSIH